MWHRRRLVKAEQVTRGPAKRLGLVAPAGQKAPAVIDGSLPAVDRDEVRAARLESGQDPAVVGRNLGTVKTAKILICGCALSDINRRAMFCQFWQCFDCSILRF